MKVNTYDPPLSPLIHGITIYDEQGDPIPRVQAFDTETYLCHVTGGKRVVAAGYAIFCPDRDFLSQMLDTLPDAMQQHIYPILLKDEKDDKEKAEVTRKAFVQKQLDHRAKLRKLLDGQ
jgi:hypothetical protein